MLTKSRFEFEFDSSCKIVHFFLDCKLDSQVPTHTCKKKTKIIDATQAFGLFQNNVIHVLLPKTTVLISKFFYIF